MQRRAALDGVMPTRSTAVRRPLEMPDDVRRSTELMPDPGRREVSTTMVRMCVCCATSLARDEKFGDRVVPIIPDEASTFGMDCPVQGAEDLRLPVRPAVRARRPQHAAVVR